MERDAAADDRRRRDSDGSVARLQCDQARALGITGTRSRSAVGLGLALQGRLDEGLAEGKRAIELDPLSPEITIDAATALAWQGKYEAAKQQARKASDLDPTFFFPHFTAGWIDIEAGKISDAIPELQKANAMDSPAWVAAWLGYAYGASGDRSHAMAAIEEQNKRSLHGYIQPWNLAIIYLGLGDRQRALDGLEKAYAAHSEWMGWLKMDRIFDPLRSEPRFIALMKKVNFEK